jgi:hypothetical protein
MYFYYFFVIVKNKIIFLIPSDLHLNFQKSLGDQSQGPPLPIAGYGCAVNRRLFLKKDLFKVINFK